MATYHFNPMYISFVECWPAKWVGLFFKAKLRKQKAVCIKRLSVQICAGIEIP